MDAITTERGLPFSGPMVLALLERRKTQTRRGIPARLLARHDPATEVGRAALVAACPYGRPGDRLYVRERVAFGFTDDWPLAVDYHADGRRRVWRTLDGARRAVRQAAAGYINDQRRPSIFMPRWAARLSYDLLDVRVACVCDISPEDALAEGVKPIRRAWWTGRMVAPNGRAGVVQRFADPDDPGDPPPELSPVWLEREERPVVEAYRDVWDHLNAARGLGWSTRPWVYALTLREAWRTGDEAFL